MKRRQGACPGRRSPSDNCSPHSPHRKIPQGRRARTGFSVAWQRRLPSSQQEAQAPWLFSLPSSVLPVGLGRACRHPHSLRYSLVLRVCASCPHLSTSRSFLSASRSPSRGSSSFPATNSAPGQEASLLCNSPPHGGADIFFPAALFGCIPSLSGCTYRVPFRAWSPVFLSASCSDPVLPNIQCRCLPGHRSPIGAQPSLSLSAPVSLSGCPVSALFLSTPTPARLFSSLSPLSPCGTPEGQGSTLFAPDEEQQQRDGHVSIPASASASSHARDDEQIACREDRLAKTEASSQPLTPLRSGSRRRMLNVVNRVQKGDVLNGLRVRPAKPRLAPTHSCL